MIEGVDYSGTAHNQSPSVEALKSAGKKFAGRYAVNDKSPDGRGIDRDEYARLRDGGIDVFLYWEGVASWMLGGWNAGVGAAQNAQANIEAAGMPADTPVYFAHDIDPEPRHFAAIDQCLAGASSVVGHDRVGIYGGWLLIDHCAKAGNVKWFCQTYAWEYGRGLHPAAHLYQYDNEQNWIDGTNVDYVRATVVDYGQAVEAPDKPEKPKRHAGRISWEPGEVGLDTLNGTPVLKMMLQVRAKRRTVYRTAASKDAPTMGAITKGTEITICGTLDSGWGFAIRDDGEYPRVPLSAFDPPAIPRPRNYKKTSR